MPYEVLIASINKSLPSITTIDTTYPVVKLYKFREEEAQTDGSYKYTNCLLYTSPSPRDS